MPVIGPAFAAELRAAGLAGLPIGWTPDGVIGLDALSPADRAAVEAVIAAHDPAAAPVTLDETDHTWRFEPWQF